MPNKQGIVQVVAEQYASADGSLTGANCANVASPQPTQQLSRYLSCQAAPA